MKPRLMTLAPIALTILLTAPGARAQSGQAITGLWDATLDLNGTKIPFKMEFAGDGNNVKGWFFNGDEKEISNSGKFENGSLILNFESYASVLKLNLKNGALDGDYSTRGKQVGAIHAVRATGRPSADAGAPDIDGIWDVENVNSSKKDEKAWRLIVHQTGGDVSGAILRVDGDTGTLTGGYKDGKFVLSHFSGARPALLTITPQRDGTLAIELAGLHHEGQIYAIRPAEARAKGLPEPTNADQHTGVKDPTRPFTFSFPDLNGKIVSNTDARFKNKVVVIVITGSWCPNCHDEAPFLEQVYAKYHSQGLEIVALSFEEAEQLQNPTRLKAFIKEYGVKYTVLLGGETASAKEKLTQAEDWDAWPTTFFVGRDGLVKGVHAGFPSPGSGELYKQETAEFVARVERLLAENQTAQR